MPLPSLSSWGSGWKVILICCLLGLSVQNHFIDSKLKLGLGGSQFQHLGLGCLVCKSNYLFLQ